MPFEITLPKFYGCPVKKQARQDTIINIYRELFHNSLPKDKQYWTMCSMQTDDKANFQEGSELGQMLSSGLLKEEQFYGVDIVEPYIINNRKAKPNAHWFCKDFLTQMKIAHKEGWYNPAIIFADLLHMKSRASLVASEILLFLESRNIKDVMLVTNIMLTNPHARIQIKESEAIEEANSIVGEFYQWKEFRMAWREGVWKDYPEYYLYKGTGTRSATRLATFIFYNKSS